jgi:hypothetical protein
MTFESITVTPITGMSLGVQYVSEEFADNYNLYSYLLIDLFIFSFVFEFSKPVTS